VHLGGPCGDVCQPTGGTDRDGKHNHGTGHGVTQKSLRRGTIGGGGEGGGGTQWTAQSVACVQMTECCTRGAPLVEGKDGRASPCP
jgi:hypothetical protein